MRKKMSILLVCALLIAYAIPVSGIIIGSGNVTVDIQDPAENYRSKVEHLDDGRLAPHPGDLSDDYMIPEVIDEMQEISLERTLESNDETIIEILLQIDEALILKYLENLTAFGPRVTGTSACIAAGDYIYNEFVSMGIQARYDDWSYAGYSGNNIEGTLVGVNETSDEIYIICAHYDSVSESLGADDDGSGTAAVLAAAYIMSQYRFNHTIRFVAFDGEEQGLLGSHEYVEEASINGDNIIAALNADMIGYAITEYQGNNIKIYENDASEWITDFSIVVSQQYYNYIQLTIIPSGYSWSSDHYSFWEFGYDAIFYHEYEFNPYWHSSQDTIDIMNTTYSTKSTKLIIATLGEFAQACLIGKPPETPDAPDGSTQGLEGEELTFSASTTDPDGDQICYKFDWDDGTYSDWLGPLNSGETIEASNIWEEEGLYEVRVKAKDVNNRVSDWSEPLEVTILENLPPDDPTIKGPRIGVTGRPLTFSFVSSDPEGHDVSYYVTWGDGTHDDWSGPFASGEEVTFSHTYTQGGKIIINAKAKDQFGEESQQSQFTLFIIKNRAVSSPLLVRVIEHLLERFPRLQYLLDRYL